MKNAIRPNNKGLTLIELLVGLVICAMVVAGIYRLFIAQSRAYTVQDQVVEVQQNIRSAMEVMLRDLRMTGFDDDRTPLVTIAQPSIVPGDDSITVRYELNNAPYEVRYWLVGGATLNRQETRKWCQYHRDRSWKMWKPSISPMGWMKTKMEPWMTGMQTGSWTTGFPPEPSAV